MCFCRGNAFLFGVKMTNGRLYISRFLGFRTNSQLSIEGHQHKARFDLLFHQTSVILEALYEDKKGLLGQLTGTNQDHEVVFHTIRSICQLTKWLQFDTVPHQRLLIIT